MLCLVWRIEGANLTTKYDRHSSTRLCQHGISSFKWSMLFSGLVSAGGQIHQSWECERRIDCSVGYALVCSTSHSIWRQTVTQTTSPTTTSAAHRNCHITDMRHHNLLISVTFVADLKSCCSVSLQYYHQNHSNFLRLRKRRNLLGIANLNGFVQPPSYYH